MKAVIQRVTAAKVMVGEDLISSIGRGLCILVGICQSDTIQDVDYMTKKILALRLFEDANGKRWAKSVKDEELEILCVSQFTLYHRLKGNKPDFHIAMQGTEANALYSRFLQKLGENYDPEYIADGKFGAYMQVHIENDGPVTIELESPKKHEMLNKETTSKTEIHE